MESQEFAKKLKELRKLASHTQQELAEKMGMQVMQIHRYESGLVPPHEKIVQLSKLYDYDFFELLKLPKSETMAIEDDPEYGKNEIIRTQRALIEAQATIIEQLKKELHEKSISRLHENDVARKKAGGRAS